MPGLGKFLERVTFLSAQALHCLTCDVFVQPLDFLGQVVSLTD